MRKITALAIALGLLGAGLSATTAQASSNCYSSPRGCVHVRGYVKPHSGTYVAPHVRNYPGSSGVPSYRAPSYRAPSYRAPSYRTPTYRVPSYR
jgi:hypothetical protein